MSDIDGNMDFKTAVSLSCMSTSFNTVRRSYEEDIFLEEAAYSMGDNKVIVEVETKLDDWILLLLVCSVVVIRVIVVKVR